MNTLASACVCSSSLTKGRWIWTPNRKNRSEDVLKCWSTSSTVHAFVRHVLSLAIELTRRRNSRLHASLITTSERAKLDENKFEEGSQRHEMARASVEKKRFYFVRNNHTKQVRREKLCVKESSDANMRKAHTSTKRCPTSQFILFHISIAEKEFDFLFIYDPSDEGAEDRLSQIC